MGIARVADIPPEQVLAYRFARHNLNQRVGAERLGAATRVGLQDSPPGAAGVALAARANVDPGVMEDLTVVFGPRGAPVAVAKADIPIFTAGREPPDEDAARAIIGNAWDELDDMPAAEALDRVGDAIAESLVDGALSRDDLHEQLRRRLPDGLLWRCERCGTNHVHPSLWRAAGVRGVLSVVGRDGNTAIFGKAPTAKKIADPGAELARRFLHAYGPSDPGLFSTWAGISRSHATGLWERVGKLKKVAVKGREAWLLAEDRRSLGRPSRPKGARLLPNLDPLHASQDRELIVPDPAFRKRIWRSFGGPGVLYADGVVAGTWRQKKQGEKLAISVELHARLSQAQKDEV